MGCRVWVVSDFVFRDPGFGFRDTGFEIRVSDFGFRTLDVKAAMRSSFFCCAFENCSGFEFRVSGFEFRLSAYGFRGSNFGFQVSVSGDVARNRDLRYGIAIQERESVYVFVRVHVCV